MGHVREMSNYDKFLIAFRKSFEEKVLHYGLGGMFRAKIHKHRLWDVYLNNIPKETGKANEMNCRACRHFLYDVGRVIFADKQTIETVWDFDADSDEFNRLLKTLSGMLKSAGIKSAWIPKGKYIGSKPTVLAENYLVDVTYNHLFVEIPLSLYDNNYVHRNNVIQLIQWQFERYQKIVAIYESELETYLNEPSDDLLNVLVANKVEPSFGLIAKWLSDETIKVQEREVLIWLLASKKVIEQRYYPHNLYVG